MPTPTTPECPSCPPPVTCSPAATPLPCPTCPSCPTPTCPLITSSPCPNECSLCPSITQSSPEPSSPLPLLCPTQSSCPPCEECPMEEFNVPGIVTNIRLSSCNVLLWDTPRDGGKCISEYKVRLYNGRTYGSSDQRSIVSVRGRNMTINWIPSTGTVSINVSHTVLGNLI
ncbi:hypothetical protein GBAR_LOCUS750 [Geodia barretti]|uniref:Uncharacterized protein n=1 Tax=Geodia barretti TaxID=519541 RepID=A0AA35QUF4_GEOBA|nr:hypothetical protein GBAR_LOCUS750 [Geodia barretti]